MRPSLAAALAPLCLPAALASANPVLANEDAAALALHDYMLNCMGCHQDDGRGVEGKVPPLVGMDRHLERPGGREYLVRVPGVAQSGLSDARLTVLMNWAVRRFGTRDFEPYTEAEVGRWRARPLRTGDDVLETARPGDAREKNSDAD